MSKKELYAAGALRTGSVDVAGKSYAIREMSASVVDESMKIYRTDGSVAANAYTVCQCVLDQSGKRLFTDSDLDDVKAMRPKLLTEIATAISKISEDDPVKN